jgi:hypothetical protein
VDVQREGRLAPGQLAHRRVDAAIARARRGRDGDPQRRRVRSRHGCAQPEAVQRAAQLPAQVAQLGHRGADLAVRVGGQLDGARVRLGRRAPGHRRRQGREDVLDAIGEGPFARLEEHHLLLEADGPRALGADGVPPRPARRDAGSEAARHHASTF